MERNDEARRRKTTSDPGGRSKEEGIETLLIGIDAACAGVLDPLLESGSLPNLESLFETGCRCPLRSQIPPWTASAWPSLYTGVNPGKHGAFGFLTYDGYDWDVVNSTTVREHALWELLDRHGRSSVVVNVPVTHPTGEIDGAIVPGYTAPEDPECHPHGVLEDVREAIGDYRIYPDRDAEQPGEYVALVEQRGAAFRYLTERFDPDFGFVQFQNTDSVFHEHPDEEEMVEAIYEAVDAEIGRILESCDPETVVVASDHGMGRYHGHEFRVNEFLAEEGYLETTTGGRGMPAWLPILEDQLRDGVDDDGSRGTAAKAIAIVSKAGITPSRVGRVLRTLGIEETVARHVPATAIRAGTEQVDFENSRAYLRSRIELGVRINLEGREPDGIVPEDEYETVREELIETLSAVRTPDGEPVFEDVAPRERYFHGPYAEDAVDVVTVPNEFDQFLSADLKGDLFGEPLEPWNHKLDGILAIAGADGPPSKAVDHAHLFDVAPTVLATMGIPTSDRMDGSVVAPIESCGRERYPPYESEEVETEDRDVENRLADLGYLE